MFFLPLSQHPFDILTLQVLLRTTQVAWNDREFFLDGKLLNVFFFAVRQRTNENVFFVVAEQLGRHGLELAAVEHIQKQSFDNVVTVMTQCNLVGANGFRIAIQSTAAQS